MGTERIYFKKTVGYTVGVRRFIGDSDGVALTGGNPVVAVDVDNLREFKLANKSAILGGLIQETPEPSIDWETENSMTDEEITELTKNVPALKSKLKRLDSVPILYKILEDAKAHDRTRRTLALIQERIDELEDEDQFSIHPDDMEKVE